MDTDEFKSRLADCSKYLEPDITLTTQSVNDLFATITLYFSASGQGLRVSQERDSLKKESLALVKLLVDILIKNDASISDGVVVAACQQLRALVRLVDKEDDLILFVVVWKDLLRLATGYPDLFQRSLDLGELFSSLCKYVGEGTAQWCAELELLNLSHDAASTVEIAKTKTSKLLLMLMNFLATILHTFHNSELNLPQYRLVASEAVCGVFGATMFIRFAQPGPSSVDAQSMLLKMFGSFDLMYGPRLAISESCTPSAHDQFHWSNIQSLAPVAANEARPGEDSPHVNSVITARTKALDPIQVPLKMLWLGRLEVLLTLAGSGSSGETILHRALVSVVLRSSDSSRIMDMAGLILTAVQSCWFGFLSENKLGLDLFRRVARALTNLLLLVDFNTSVGALGGWLGDTHPLVRELASTCGICFAMSLSSVQVGAFCLSFVGALNDKECCPLFAVSCSDFLIRCLSCVPIREADQLALLEHIPPSLSLTDMTAPPSPHCCQRHAPVKLRLLLSIVRPPSIRILKEGHNNDCFWRGPGFLCESAKAKLRSRCSEYDKCVITMLRASSLSSAHLDCLVDLCITLLAPISRSAYGQPYEMLCSPSNAEKLANFVVTQLIRSMEGATKTKAFQSISNVIRQCGDASSLGQWSLPLERCLHMLKQSLDVTLKACAGTSVGDDHISVFTSTCLSLTRIGSVPSTSISDVNIIAEMIVHVSKQCAHSYPFQCALVVLKHTLSSNNDNQTAFRALFNMQGNDESKLLQSICCDEYHHHTEFGSKHPLDLHAEHVQSDQMAKLAQSMKRQRIEQKRLGTDSSSLIGFAMNNGIAKWSQGLGASSCFDIPLNESMYTHTSFDGSKLRLTFEFNVDPSSSSSAPFRVATMPPLNDPISKVSLQASAQQGVFMKVSPPE